LLSALRYMWNEGDHKRHVETMGIVIGQLSMNPSFAAEEMLRACISFVGKTGLEGVDGVFLTCMSAAEHLSEPLFGEGIGVLDMIGEGVGPGVRSKGGMVICFGDLSITASIVGLFGQSEGRRSGGLSPRAGLRSGVGVHGGLGSRGNSGFLGGGEGGAGMRSQAQSAAVLSVVGDGFRESLLGGGNPMTSILGQGSGFGGAVRSAGGEFMSTASAGQRREAGDAMGTCVGVASAVGSGIGWVSGTLGGMGAGVAVGSLSGNPVVAIGGGVFGKKYGGTIGGVIGGLAGHYVGSIVCGVLFDEGEDPPSDPSGDPPSDPSGDPPSDPSGDPSSDPSGDPPSDPSGDPPSDPSGDPPSDPSGDPPSDPSGNSPSDPSGNSPSGDPPGDASVSYGCTQEPDGVTEPFPPFGGLEGLGDLVRPPGPSAEDPPDSVPRPLVEVIGGLVDLSHLTNPGRPGFEHGPSSGGRPPGFVIDPRLL